MIKLALGKSLEERKADCNFCGEEGKDCVKGSIPTVVEYRVPITEYTHVFKDAPKYEMVIEDYSRGLFGGRYFEDYKFKHTGDYTIENVIKNWETKKVTAIPDICKDCIRQLAKLI